MVQYMFHIRSCNDLFINMIPTRWPWKKDSSKVCFNAPVYKRSSTAFTTLGLNMFNLAGILTSYNNVKMVKAQWM